MTIPKESSRYKSERELKKLLGRMELLAIDVLLTAAEGGNETATRFLLKHWREILSRLKP